MTKQEFIQSLVDETQTEAALNWVMNNSPHDGARVLAVLTLRKLRLKTPIDQVTETLIKIVSMWDMNPIDTTGPVFDAKAMDQVMREILKKNGPS